MALRQIGSTVEVNWTGSSVDFFNRKNIQFELEKYNSKELDWVHIDVKREANIINPAAAISRGQVNFTGVSKGTYRVIAAGQLTGRQHTYNFIGKPIISKRLIIN